MRGGILLQALVAGLQAVVLPTPRCAGTATALRACENPQSMLANPQFRSFFIDASEELLDTEFSSVGQPRFRLRFVLSVAYPDLNFATKSTATAISDGQAILEDLNSTGSLSGSWPGRTARDAYITEAGANPAHLHQTVVVMNGVTPQAGAPGFLLARYEITCLYEGGA